MHTNIRGIALIALAAALAACGGKEQPQTTDSTMGALGRSGADTTAATAAAAKLPPKTSWSGGAVLAFLTVATSAETQASGMADQNAGNPAVKAFARQVVADDNAMMTDIQDAAKKSGAQPDMKDRDVQALIVKANADAAGLSKEKKGAAWDKRYLEIQLGEDRSILAKLQEASKTTSDDDVRAALDRAIAKVQAHITKAQELSKS